jgi:mono/diheme cytochrome c family protein
MRSSMVAAGRIAHGLLALTLALGAWAQDAGAPASPTDATSPPTPLPAGQMTPLDREKASPQGTLKNPYHDDNADIVAQGEKLYLQHSCNGCHGGNGGGGICPPLINDTWVYGGDDDTLFRLVSLGSIDLQAKGYVRKGRENVVAPMPSMGPIISSDDELWKILTFIRAHYDGSPSRKYGTPPEPPPSADASSVDAPGSAAAPAPEAVSK